MTGHGKILIIEDDKLILKSLREACSEAGYQTIVATDVAGGQRQARFGRPDLIILDLGLPDGNGLDVLEVLADIGSLVPVLVLTGLDPAEVKMPALRSGVQQFLKKPVRKAQLLHAITKLIAASDNAGDGWSSRSGGVFDWHAMHSRR